jgi:hypothetical protein
VNLREGMPVGLVADKLRNRGWVIDRKPISLGDRSILAARLGEHAGGRS